MFIRNVLLSFFGLLVFVITLTSVVDPFGAFNPGEPTKFKTRYTKFFQMQNKEADVLLVGGSRTAFMNADLLADRLGLKVYNGGVMGTTPFEIEWFTDYALDKLGPREVFIGLSFYTFSSSRGKKKRARSIWSDGFIDNTKNYISSLYSLNAIRRSIKALQESGFQLAPDGSITDELIYRRVIRGKPSVRSSLSRYRRRVFTKKWAYNKRRLAPIRRILTRAKSSGTKVFLYIPPPHPKLIRLIYNKGHLGAYTEWLKDLTDIAPVIDFSQEDFLHNRRAFIDVSHMAPKSSRKVLQALGELSQNQTPSYGQLLTQENVTEYGNRFMELYGQVVSK